MIRKIVLSVFLLVMNTVSAFAQNAPWYYGVGTLQDKIYNNKIEFTLADGTVLNPLPAGATGASYALGKPLGDSYLFSYKGGQQMRTELPVKLYVEWVSYVDKKRYGVSTSLPDNLRELNQHCDDRLVIAVGTAPNGYYEVYLTDPCTKHEVLLTRGIAPEVVTSYDKTEPLANQFEKRWASFDKYYSHLIKQYPIPYWRFSLDQPPIVSTYPNNVWGNRQPTQEWLDRMAAQQPKPKATPKNRCWHNKPAELDKAVTLVHGSNEFQMQRLLWNNAPKLILGVNQAGNDENAAIMQAWQEAKQKGLDDEHAQVWVLACLVGLTDYPLDRLYKELKVSAQGQDLIKGYVDQMCQS